MATQAETGKTEAGAKTDATVNDKPKQETQSAQSAKPKQEKAPKEKQPRGPRANTKAKEFLEGMFKGNEYLDSKEVVAKGKEAGFTRAVIRTALINMGSEPEKPEKAGWRWKRPANLSK